MLKGINLQAKVHLAGDQVSADKFGQSLASAFAQANPGLRLDVKKVSPPDSQGNATIRVYIEGEQDPAADFAALTRGALNKAVTSLGASKGSNTAGVAGTSAAPHLHDVQELEDPDDDSGIVLPPKAHLAQPAPSSSPSAPVSAPPSPPSPQPASTSQATQSQRQNQGQGQDTAASQPPWWAFWKRGK